MQLDLNELKEKGGLLLVDKPVTWTSFDVVNKLRYALKIKKIGHAGTLDPLATGLLLIGVGKGTKLLNDLQGLDKSYTGIIELGKTTASYDMERPFEVENDTTDVTEEIVSEQIDKLTGVIEQIPPSHSAVKVNGTRAYKLARQNEEVIIKKRTVSIHQFDYQLKLPEVIFDIRCSKGTYIRSIANDLGQLVGVGGYLKLLRRTSVGDYHIKNAWQLDALIDEIQGDGDN
ncbi:MAG: tRNA pseudouridine55 synthase [Cyclobacteriaceae bacterium]|jgi:tRNA pseudouridine55 synthase